MKKTLGLGAIMMVHALACSGSGGDGGNGGNGGSGGSGGGGGSGDIPLDKLAEPLAAAVCAGMEACAPLYVPNACVARMTIAANAGMVPSIAAGVTAGDIVYHGTEAEQCLADLSHTCMFNGGELPVSCLAMAEGKVAPDGACTIDLECAGGLRCAGATCPGKCTARSAAGAVCTEDDDCAAGLGCPNDVCVTRLPQGATCTNGSSDCAVGLMCLQLAGAATSTCEPMTAIMTGAENAPCAFGAAPSLCKAGLSCVFTDNDPDKGGFCKPKVASKAACGAALPTPCPGEEVCVSGVCGAAPAVGSPCAPDFSGQCAVGASCDDSAGPAGLCVALAANGATCADDEACQSGNCYDSKCGADQDCGPQ